MFHLYILQYVYVQCTLYTYKDIVCIREMNVKKWKRQIEKDKEVGAEENTTAITKYDGKNYRKKNIKKM